MDKASFYHFIADEKPLFLALCKDLYGNAEDADVTFITKNKVQVKAHRLVLSLSSTFFRNLFDDYSRLEHKLILLPNYSSGVLQAFLQFFYTGEILVDDTWIGELASLCHEFNCGEEIPVLSELIAKHKECKSDDITRIVAEEPKSEIDFDESEFFESNDNVETIFFNENEGEFLEAAEIEQKTNEAKEQSSGEPRVIKEEYENVQYIDDDNPNFELVEENEKNKLEVEAAETKREDDPQLYEDLELAAGDVRKGMSFWNAHKKYGLSRNMILRHLQKTGEQRKKVKAAHLKQSTASIPALAMNINQLREEQNRFKKRLQEAINSCRDSGNTPKKAAKMFGVPIDAIERNLRGFKKGNL